MKPSAVAWLGALTVAQLLGLDGGVVMLAPLAGQWWLLVHLLRRTGGSRCAWRRWRRTLPQQGTAALFTNAVVLESLEVYCVQRFCVDRR